MALYTIVLDFDGGTYIRQERAADADTAVAVWEKRKSVRNFLGLRHTKGSLFDEEVDRIPVALKGLRNVWCTSALVGEKLALINVVKTVDGKS